MAFGAALAAGAPPLVLDRTIALPEVTGRIDHLAFDPARGQLLVAELGNDTVDVIDLHRGTLIRRLTGFHEPQGIGYAPRTDTIAIANGGDGTVRLLRGSDDAPIATTPLGSDADDIRVDPQSGAFLVGYGEGGIATLNPANGALLAQIPLPAHPEGFQLDPASRRLFVNIPDSQQIAVLDPGARKPLTTWRTPDLRGNFPMALADGGKTVIVAFRDPARLVALNAADGTIRASLDTCGDADDVFTDEKRKRLYVSCGEGFVDVFATDRTPYRPIGRIATKSGARTSLFVPEIDRLIVAARANLFGYGTGAEILVLRPN